MDFLKKELAPLDSFAWEEIDERAKEVLIANLSARKFADVLGPFGWDYAAYPTGRLKKGDASKEVCYATRLSLPLVELYVPFELSICELDAISRGLKSPDLTNLEEAARKLASFEDKSVFYGLEDASVEGLFRASQEFTIELPLQDPSDLLASLTQVKLHFTQHGIEGPYALVAGLALWSRIYSIGEGYPLYKKIGDVLEDGKIVFSPNVNDGIVVSLRGGDFELILGQDISIGYKEHKENVVLLYFTESFTFNVVTPEAAVPLKLVDQ